MAHFILHQAGGALVAELDHVGQLEQCEAKDADRGCIDQKVRGAQVVFQGSFQRGQCLLVDAQEQCLGGGRGQDLIEKSAQGIMRNFFQSQGRFAHFADACPQSLYVLRAKVGLVGEAGLELIDRLGGDARGQDFVQAHERVMVALEPAHAGRHAQAGLRRLADARQPRQGRQAAIGVVIVDTHHGEDLAMFYPSL